MRLSVIRCACLGLSLALVISAPVSATVYDAPPGAVPTSLLAGDVLNIGAGRSTTSSFTAATGSLINVVGGTVALSAAPLNSDANVYSGFFQPAQVNGAVNVYGGTADSFTAQIHRLSRTYRERLHTRLGARAEAVEGATT